MVKTSKLVTLPAQIQQLVSKEWWPVLLETGMAAVYKKGSYIIRVGERDKYVRVGLSGWIALQRGENILGLASTSMQTNALGKENLPATADIVTITEVTAVLLDREQLTDALLNSPQQGLLTLLRWSARNIDMIVSFSAMKSCSLDIGLAALLWTIGEPVEGGRKKVPTSIPQHVLARALGASREEVSRKRQMLIMLGYILIEGDSEYMDAMTPMLIAESGF